MQRSVSAGTLTLADRAGILPLLDELQTIARSGLAYDGEGMVDVYGVVYRAGQWDAVGWRPTCDDQRAKPPGGTCAGFWRSFVSDGR